MSGDWVVGRLAQRKASETPGRVVQSAKSWLCHHAADRTAPFLPWLSDTVAEQDKISPVTASALILAHLRAAWNDRFCGQGPGFEFDAQDITITVPASFDAAAQRLTLARREASRLPRSRASARRAAGGVLRLAGTEADRPIRGARLPDPRTARAPCAGDRHRRRHFGFQPVRTRRREGGGDPAIKRVAVSDHILLGGDNIDLAIAHLAETRLAAGDAGLSAAQWDHLIAQCRSLKERALR